MCPPTWHLRPKLLKYNHTAIILPPPGHTHGLPPTPLLSNGCCRTACNDQRSLCSLPQLDNANDFVDEYDWMGTFWSWSSRPAVAGAIVGTRLGLTDHSDDNQRVFGLKLDDEDRSRRAILPFFLFYRLVSSRFVSFFFSLCRCLNRCFFFCPLCPLFPSSVLFSSFHSPS